MKLNETAWMEERMETIRATKTWQHAGVYYVRTESMVKGFNIPLDIEFDENDTPETKYTLLLDNNLPVATCRLHVLDKNTAKIERVCVLPQYRGKGVGRRLIIDTENWFRELGINKVIITSRDEAVGFYESLGYKADWDRTEQDVFLTVYTEKTL